MRQHRALESAENSGFSMLTPADTHGDGTRA